jgi:hypothetical protein
MLAFSKQLFHFLKKIFFHIRYTVTGEVELKKNTKNFLVFTKYSLCSCGLIDAKIIATWAVLAIASLAYNYESGKASLFLDIKHYCVIPSEPEGKNNLKFAGKGVIYGETGRFSSTIPRYTVGWYCVYESTVPLLYHCLENVYFILNNNYSRKNWV